MFFSVSDGVGRAILYAAAFMVSNSLFLYNIIIAALWQKTPSILDNCTNMHTDTQTHGHSDLKSESVWGLIQ